MKIKKNKLLNINYLVPEPSSEEHAGKKRLYKMFDTYLLELLLAGLVFFHLTVNFITGKDSMTKLFDYLLENEKDSNYSYNVCYKHISNILNRGAEFVDISFGAIENNQEGTHPHCHILIGYRAISDDYKGIEAQTSVLLETQGIEDFQLKYLKTERDIKNVFIYVTKEFHKIRPWDSFFLASYSNINFKKVHSRAFSDIVTSSLFNIKKLGGTCVYNRLNYDYNNYFDKTTKKNNTLNISGFKFQKNESKIFLILHYLNIYFQLKKMFLFKNNLYRRIEDTLISCTLLGDLNFLQNNILDYLKELSQEITSLSYMDLANFYTLNLESVVKKMGQISEFQKYIFNWNILEFTDGLFFVDYNKFISKEEVINNRLNLKIDSSHLTLRYYNITYNYVRKNLNTTLWGDKVKIQFSNLNEEEYKNFIKDFYSILFTDTDTKKSNVLFIAGVSNSGKTQLVTNMASRSYGEQNVGTMNSDFLFLSDNLQNKTLITADEFEFTKKSRSTLLKIRGGELLNVNKKHQDSITERLTNKIIFTSNYTTATTQVLKDPAFLNRINLYKFDRTINLTTNDIKRITEECPLILLKLAKENYINKDKKGKRKLSSIFKSNFKRIKSADLNNEDLFFPEDSNLTF